MRLNFNLFNIVFRPEDLEQLGTKEKFWFVFDLHQDDRWLFKFSRPNTGEHWSEKVAEQLCKALGIPHAEYQLATSLDRPGIISKNLISPNSRLVMGNEVLHTSSPGEYPPPQVDDAQFVRVREHTISRVLGCLDRTGVLPPPGDWELGDLNAGDVFCGYLLLDALISNQDRHHENWAIILDQSTQEKFLCPTYDHASSLGRELTDDNRALRLSTRDVNQQVGAFVKKARSQFFKNKTDKHSLLTIDAFFHSVEKRENAKVFWLGKLAQLQEDQVEEIFSKIPEALISKEAKEFAIRVILENKNRLLNDERN